MNEENKENVNQMENLGTEVKSSRKNGPEIFQKSHHQNSAVLNLDHNNPIKINLEGDISWMEQTAFNSTQLLKNQKGHIRIQTESFLTE